MGIVLTEMSMSLDGYVATAEDDVTELHRWYGSGDVETPTGSPGYSFRTSQASAAVLRNAMADSGALITGRRNFDLAGGWGGSHPLAVPVVVVTHSVPGGWPRDDAPFSFVDDIARAVDTAKSLAGERNVVIASPDIAQQCLNHGLLDEIVVSLVPVLLGSGIPLFAHLDQAPIVLGNPIVVQGTGVTHLRFTVHKVR